MEDPIALDMVEMTDFVVRRLKLEGIAIDRDIVERVFDLEHDFMFIKGIVDEPSASFRLHDSPDDDS